MSTFELPAPDAPAAECGRLAVSIPDWRWLPGMLVHATVEGYPCMYRLDGADEGLYKKSWILVHECRIYEGPDDVTGLWPDPDDTATAGCFEGMLGGPVAAHAAVMADPVAARLWRNGHAGRARIAAAAALGRWPGGGA